MNIRVSFAAVIALSTAVFAADPVVPVAEPASGAPTVGTETSATAPEVEPVAAAPAVATETPATTPAAEPVAEAPAAPDGIAAPETPAPVEPAAAPVAAVPAPPAEYAVPESAPAEAVNPVMESDAEMPAPVAVRGVQADGSAPTASSAAPTPVENYAEAFSGENAQPTPASAPAGTAYAMGPASADQRPASYVRILVNPVPMKFEVGIQAFIGSNSLYDNNWDFDDSYSGIAWRAGAFALFPLNEFTMGIKIGILYDHSDAKASYLYSNDLSKEANVKFKQDKISIPFLFSFKSTYSRFMFDMGAQFSVPVRDEFKYYYEKSDGTAVDGKADMIDLDYRASLDFALVFGFSIRANNLISFDARFDLGFSNLYDSVPGWRINDLSSSTLLLGISFHVI